MIFDIDFEIANENLHSMIDVDTLINQLKMIDNSEIMINLSTFGDYNRFGCEFILNGILIPTTDDKISIPELIENDYSNVRSHSFDLINHWDSWLFYSPSDIRGLVFDFSRLNKDNKIICYDGLSGRNHSYDVVKEFTPKEFISEYGTKIFYSAAHWNVTWNKIGYSWNN